LRLVAVNGGPKLSAGALMGNSGGRKNGAYGGSLATGLDFQSAAELTDTLAHSLHAYTGLGSGGSHALAFIADFYPDLVVGAEDANAGDRTIRVAVNVGERLLDEAKNSGFHVARKATEIGGEFEINFNVTALGKPFHVPLQSKFQSGFVQHGRVQQVGNGSQFLG